MARHRHPCDREFRRWPLNRIVLEAVREALCWKGGHRPDSSRQVLARRRAKDLRQARLVKGAPAAIVAPPDLVDRGPHRFFW